MREVALHASWSVCLFVLLLFIVDPTFFCVVDVVFSTVEYSSQIHKVGQKGVAEQPILCTGHSPFLWQLAVAVIAIKPGSVYVSLQYKKKSWDWERTKSC